MADESAHPDLTPDVAAPARGHADGVVTVPGILGEGADEKSVRIYLDAARSTYYDIPKDAVSGRQRVDAADSPFGVQSTLLSVNQGTRITAQYANTRTIEFEFLAGDFTAPGSFRALTWVAPSGIGGRASSYSKAAGSGHRTSEESGCTSQPKPFCNE